MNRKSKLFFSLVSLCFSVAILCFGVYSAMQVSYSISGSISYELNDVFVDIETSLYLSTSNGLTDETTLTSKISEFETTLPTNGASETVEHSTFTDTYSSYSNETGLNVDNKPVSNNIPINYGAYQQDTTAYAYYIIVSITNLAENTINAVLDLGDTSNLNSIVDRNQGSSNIAGKETVYFIIGMALDDATLSVNETFKYIITITTGELEEPILYTCPDPAYIEANIGEVILYPYNITEQGVDITTQSLTQQVSSVDVQGANVAMAQYTLDLTNASFQNIDNSQLNVSSDSSFIYALILSGINYQESDALTILEPIMNDEVVLDYVVGYYSAELTDDNGVNTCTIEINYEKLSQTTELTIMLAGMQALNNVTVSNLQATVKESPNWIEMEDSLLDHYMITNGNAEDNYFTYEMQGEQIKFFFQNFKIENLTSNYNLTMYLDYLFSDSWGFTFIYPGYYSSEDIIDSFINGTQPSRPEDVPPYYDMLDAREAYEPMYLNSSDTDNGTIEFCIFSMFFLTYDNLPNTPLLHLCISDKPIAAELNENDGYTVRFIEDTEGSYTIPSTYNGKEINAIDLRVGSYGTLVIPNTINSISLNSFHPGTFKSVSVDTLVLEEGVEYFEFSLYSVYVATLEIRDVNFANNIQSSDITLDADQSLPTFKVKCNSLDEITNEWLKSSAFTQPTETVDGYAIFIPA